MLDLDARDRCFVIAEAGTCHTDQNPERRLKQARKYVKAAADAGADAVKFQMFMTPIKKHMFCWINGDEDRLKRWEKSEIPYEGWFELKEMANSCDIVFLASVFQYNALETLKRLDLPATKVASRATRNFPYSKATPPFLVSMGMHPAPEGPGVVALECESNYPSTAEWSGRENVGFSDHSGNPDRAIDAIRRGCQIVEVHYYIRRHDAGPDLPASLDLNQLRLVCEARDAFAEM